MPQSPIPAGSVIYVGKTDPNDPETPIEAFLVTGDKEEDWKPLGNSFGADPQDFLWAMSCLATFHHLDFQNESGVEKP